MPKVTEIYPSKYLSAADLGNHEVVATISRVEMDEFDDNGRKATKPVVYFEGHSKGLVANKTNSISIADITGQDDTDNWPGARICLYPTMVQFGAKMKEAIRVKRPPEPGAVAVVPPAPVQPVAPTAPAVSVNPQVDADLDDGIPF